MLKKADVTVFDFDGTLSAGDCNRGFARFCMCHSLRPWLYSPLMLICGVLRVVRPGGKWWREHIRRFMTADMVRRFSPEFIRMHRTRRFDWAARQIAAEHAAGRMVVLISAGPDYLIPELVRDLKFDAVICSVMHADRPWKYKFLCWGPNKVVALDTWARQNHIIPRVVRSYSDSKSDMPMMNIADKKIWVDARSGKRSE